jgi:hypothetical protein
VPWLLGGFQETDYRSLKDKPYYEEMTRQLLGGRPQRTEK